MSLDVRWLTNGDKNVYTVRDKVADTFNTYDSLEDIPASVRYYAAKIEKPMLCEPDTARFFGVIKVFYPDWPKKCGHPEYQGKYCIAEMCRFGGENKGWEKCKYFTNEKFK